MQDMINAVYSDDATPFNHCFIADSKSFAVRNPKDPKTLIAGTRQLLSWGKDRTWYLPKQAKQLTDGTVYSRLLQMK